MLIDISRLKAQNIVTIDGRKYQDVSRWWIRRTDEGDEIVLTIKIKQGEFVEFVGS